MRERKRVIVDTLPLRVADEGVIIDVERAFL